MGAVALVEVVSTSEHICQNCRVICRQQDGAWVHPEPWATLKAKQICDDPRPLRQAKPREIKSGSMPSVKRDKQQKEEQLRQLVGVPGSFIEVAIVGWYELHSVNPAHPRGWGYLASDGHYGFGATTTQKRFDGPGELAAEARALFWAIRKLVPLYRVTLLTDYQEIANLVDAWRNGDESAMPPGYDTAAGESGHERKLVLAARKVHKHADLVAVRLVDHYTKTVLGVGANELAHLGWQWSAGEITKSDAEARALALASEVLNVDPVLVARDDQVDGAIEANEDE
ncbi:hypothetical protein AB0C15_29810 [Micromonospora sp. NPDC048835]|uniref:hypothetical protein n=1 Tax=Micromonospora sp. NPDC048835 TaxID=3155147 RepID=UPI0033E487C9